MSSSMYYKLVNDSRGEVIVLREFNVIENINNVIEFLTENKIKEFYINYKNNTLRIIGEKNITTHILVHFPNYESEWVDICDNIYDYEFI